MKIKTHKMKKEYSGEYFFVLSKGTNAGKPITKPCPNCFVLLAENAVEKEQLYWLCHGLWEGGFFRKFLTGSIIPFIHLADISQVITVAAEKITEQSESFEHALKMVKILAQYHDLLIEQLRLIKLAKRGSLHKLLK